MLMSMTQLLKQNPGITKEMVVSRLRLDGYLLDENTPTTFGKENGVSVIHRIIEGESRTWLAYDETIQEIVGQIAQQNYKTLSKYAKEHINIDGSILFQYLETKGYIKDGKVTPYGKKYGLAQKEKTNSKGQTYTYYLLSPSFQNYLNKHIEEIRVEKNKESTSLLPNVDWKHLKLKNFVIIDTGTTGLRKKDQVTELSIIDANGKELYHSSFCPDVPMRPCIGRKSRLTRKALEQYPKFADEWSNMYRFLRGKVIIGHNIPYDMRMIKQTLEAQGVDASVLDDMPIKDSMDIAKQYLDLSVYNLDDLTTSIGITQKEEHRTTADCQMTLAFLKRLEDILTIKEDYDFVKSEDAQKGIDER